MNEAVLKNKQAAVDEIATKMKEAKSMIVVEYRGLDVKEVTELRKNLRAEGVEFKVYKNSLTQRAVSAIGVSELSKELVGPNAIAFGSDAVAPARVLADFAKKHDKLVLKGGIVEGNIADVEMIKELSQLPSREGMISMFLGCLQSPVRDFACILKAVADSKEA